MLFPNVKKHNCIIACPSDDLNLANLYDKYAFYGKKYFSCYNVEVDENGSNIIEPLPNKKKEELYYLALEFYESIQEPTRADMCHFYFFQLLYETIFNRKVSFFYRRNH